MTHQAKVSIYSVTLAPRLVYPVNVVKQEWPFYIYLFAVFWGTACLDLLKGFKCHSTIVTLGVS